MSESDRHQQLHAVFGGKFSRYPVSECGRCFPEIDGDIKYPSADAPHQLVLRMWRNLKMNSPQRPGRARQRVVVLDEAGADTQFRKIAFLEGFGKPASMIADSPGLHEPDWIARQSSLSCAARPTGWPDANAPGRPSA